MSRSLRVLLFAHQQVGVTVLNGLREAGHEIVACFTHPPSHEGVPSVAEACAAARIPCLTATPAASDAGAYRSERPDLIVSAGYRQRVGLPFLALPRWGSVNLHLGPLPQYRGASPIPWGILRHEPSWAVTLHAMTHNYNDGGILRKQPVALRENDNAYDLFLRCSRAGAQLTVEAVNEIADGGGALIAQELRNVQFFDTARPYGGHIDWNQSAVDLAAFVRAMDFGRGPTDRYEHLTMPAAATLGAADIGIWRARAGGTASSYAPGTITRCDDEVWIQTGRGHLVIERICDSSGRDFEAIEYLTEHKHVAGDSFATAERWRNNPQVQLGFAA